MIENELSPVQNKRINTVPFSFSAEWKISLDLFIDDSVDISNYRNVFRIGLNEDPQNESKCGDRYPVLFSTNTAGQS